MIYQFPYTDLYNLNLDWMIKAIKEMQEIVGPLSSVVNSVNGMTGDVVITRQFLMGILESMVSTFNGRDGAVTLTAADVNGTLIDITWTSDPGDVIGDLSQSTLNQLYADGKRVLIFVNNQGVPDTMYFLTLVGNVVTPQIYSPTAALAGVASFNGQTGAVTVTGSDLDTADDDPTPISESIGDLQDAVSDLGPLNVLTSDSTTAALSAAQGKALKGMIDDLGPLNVLTSDSTTAALSAAQGKALKGMIDGLALTQQAQFTVNQTTVTIYYSNYHPIKMLSVYSNDISTDIPNTITIDNGLAAHGTFVFTTVNAYAYNSAATCAIDGTSVHFVTKDNYLKGAVMYY